MRLITNWRPSLRMAWRDARRSRGRSILVLVMIALPVLAVTAADVVIQTANVSGTEALERRLGTADARVHFESGVTSALQGFDPDDASSWSSSRKPQPPPGPDDIAAVLGRDVRAVEWREAYRLMTTDKGKLEVRTSVLDLSDPLAEGTFRLERGSLAGSPDEVVINNDLAKRGFGIGDEIEVDKVGTLTVVGIGEAADQRDTPTVVGLSPGLASESGTTWLVDAGPVTWDDVLELNKIGGLVLSRAVMENPPPESEIPAEIRSWSGTDDAWVAVAGLVVMMALIEVVLLAGPAFAVGARRQSRNLALIAASGGTPRQSRRVILASALVLGSLGAALGVVLGLGAAAVALPVVQRFDGSWFGPFDVPWLHLVGIAGFGLLSAFLAAVVPAWLASRQDVVAVLAGRRGDRPAGMRSPILGAVVLGIGVALSAYGATAQSGEFVIAFAALPTVLGMILLVPVAVAAVARLSRRFPLTMRYATRDAARHRTRTVPAVAAVAATVAGVVALGIANASDAKQSEATYTPSLPEGMASVSVYRASDDDWTQIQDVVAAELPSNEVTEMRGLRENRALASFRTDDGRVDLEGWGSSYGSSVMVTDQADETVLPGLSEEERSRAQEALAAGGAVVWSSADQTADEVRIRVKESGRRNSEGQNAAATVPAYFVHPETWNAPGQAVLSTEAARAVGVEPQLVGLAIAGGVSKAQESDVSEALRGITVDAGLYVERGYESDSDTVILLLVLGVLGGVLMLGGTLTATFLALSDARPDLATLSAVGASPRTRRGVASSYAAVIGLVGALLGAVVGFVPGIAATYPLTGQNWYPEGDVASPSHYLDIPWLLVGALVLVLPLLTAAIVWVFARSRLPLVARLD